MIHRGDRDTSRTRGLIFGPGIANVRPTVNTPAGKAVVVVDDEKSYGELLSQLLTETLHVPVRSFSNPREALDALPELDVGFVITDYHMPDMTGVQFIRRAAEALPGVPFIIITGHPLRLIDEYIDDLEPLKAVVPKPLDWRRLGALVERHWPGTSKQSASA